MYSYKEFKCFQLLQIIRLVNMYYFFFLQFEPIKFATQQQAAYQNEFDSMIYYFCLLDFFSRDIFILNRTILYLRVNNWLDLIYRFSFDFFSFYLQF